MRMKMISVAEYVAEDFDRPMTPINESDVGRVFRLVNAALQDIEWPEWELAGGLFHSTNRNEPFGLEEIGGKFYVYAEERGKREAIAIFKDDHLAAKYFVWLISQGTRSIDWQRDL